MKKLNKEQKDLVIKKLEESGQFPDLVAKAKKDPDAGVTDKEWNKARKKVVSTMMRESDSRFFHVAPLLARGGSGQSKTMEWLFDNRDTVGFALIVAGTALVFLDPGTFAARGKAPAMAGISGYIAMISYLLNWGAMGWGGVGLILGGYLWSRHPKLFLG